MPKKSKPSSTAGSSKSARNSPAGKAAAEQVLHIGDLTPDPKNCRKHNARNLGAIVNSLHKVGAARSIVIDEDGVILAGNGLVEAAGQAGIENVKVVEADGNTVIAVRRRGLTPKQKAELGIADNRTTELSDWDPEQLIKTLSEFSIDPADVEFTEEEIEQLGDEAVQGMKDAAQDKAAVDPGADRYMVVITCRDEAHQAELLERFDKDGLQTRALIG